MSKRSWNVFTAENPTAAAFTSQVSSRLPRQAPLLDRAGKRLPTPYGLLLEWVGKNLTGDWCSMTTRGVVVIKVRDTVDAARVTSRFHPIHETRATELSPTTMQINYRDEMYGALAAELGYQLR